ncbi:hypothetical protein MLD38_023330 [Melastoma candidum]|uniref:Uncharacterized protein n=1 Tax=Melastoma candidum TaxID=119954 RepID=A0ACB9QND6_9MYRT|nr:hypothetical protein MLD38_023330 [Melastoma candidum]
MASSAAAAPSARTRQQVTDCLPGSCSRRVYDRDGSSACNRVAFASRFPTKEGLRLRVRSTGRRSICMSNDPKVSASAAAAAVVTRESWDKSILQSECPVLVEFYASWCGPCRMVRVVMDEIARDYEGKIKCYLLNTDHDLQVARDYQVKAVPVVMVFKGGERRESMVGTVPRSSYEAAIHRVMDS